MIITQGAQRDGVLRLETADGQAIVLRDGRIADRETRPDLVINVGAGRFHAGLINAHDHLHRNHYPRLGFPPYEDAYAWGLDIHARAPAEIARAKTLDRTNALLFGALKNILGGVTTVVHHDAWEPAFDADFPVRVQRVRTMHSLGFERDIPAALADASIDALLCIHLAEGVNPRAADEVAELERYGLLDERLLAVHAVGVEPPGIARLQKAGAAIVWCPTSNHFLFGATCPRALFDSGIDTLLGTDALLTGAGTLLDELRAARALGYLSDERLWASVGVTAARRLGLPAPSLQPGATADIILLRAPLLEVRPADVAMVLVGGQPVLVDEAIDGLAIDGGVAIMAGGIRKVVPAAIAHAAERACTLFPECGRILA